MGIPVLLVVSVLCATAGAMGAHGRHVHSATPGARNCTTLYFDQVISHFNWAPPPEGSATFKQRFLLNDQHWKEGSGPIFFYTGNEGNVELYANSTGLMWEHAEAFGALLIFAEHRYYGQSQPFNDPEQHLEFLTAEQALADYVTLIAYLKRTMGATDCPVVAFGGSYGGMLSSWLRIKYPATVVGAIAASAPILAFGDWDSNLYWQVVTRDASPAGGSAERCVPNTRSAWPKIFQAAQTEEGRATLSKAFKLCKPLRNESDAYALAIFHAFAFDTMAMGEFPFPSNYLTAGGPLLPAWPVRVACSHLAAHFDSDLALFEGLRDAAGVYNNASKDLSCYTLPDPSDEFDGIWEYQWCTEMLPQETYFTTDGVRDMFWPRPFNMTYVRERCAREYNVAPRPTWIPESIGAPDVLDSSSNIVFTNGLLDPWSAGGVLENRTASPTVVAIHIAEGAHHLDLMFSHEDDPPSVLEARAVELMHIRKWIGQ